MKNKGNTVKPKGKPRGKPFTAHDQRANQHGQRNKKAVAFARTIREILTATGDESLSITLDTGGKVTKKKIEWLCQKIWSLAINGNVAAIGILLDRIEGKVPQAVTGPEGGPIDTNVNLKITVIDTKG